jgi:hypothetical protein
VITKANTSAAKQLARATAYLAKLPPAISGQGGHAATFNAACRLVEFGLSFEEAFPVLADWNLTHCQPPWTERELRHKLADAFKKTRVRADFAGPGNATNARRRAALSVASGHNRLEMAPTEPQTGKRLPHLRYERRFESRQVDCMGENPHLRRQLASPNLALTAGTAADFAALAKLRGISADAVALASERGLLRFGEHRHRPAWFILDASGRVAQARRLDGRNWFGDVKALNLASSQAAWPVGIQEAAPFPLVALCEGGPDLLAAYHLILREQRQADCAPVAMLGANPPIHPAALPLFAGKRVRIFGHDDLAGEQAVVRWATQLVEVGADVDGFRFSGLVRTDGQPVKDLNDLARVVTDDNVKQNFTPNLFP